MKRETKTTIPGQAVRPVVPQDTYKGKEAKWKPGTPTPFRPQFNFGVVSRTTKPE